MNADLKLFETTYRSNYIKGIICLHSSGLQALQGIRRMSFHIRYNCPIF
jgi:hypothetical protein